MYKQIKLLESKLLEANKNLTNIKNILANTQTQLDNTTKLLENVYTELNKYKLKGSLCSINGKKYETTIFNIVQKCTLNNTAFNTQLINELGGSSNKIDILCNFRNIKDIGIEIKKAKSPDWCQSIIKYNTTTNMWETTGKHPTNCKLIFNKLINDIKLFDGILPPFINKNLTYDDWTSIKNTTNIWDDLYIDIPSDTIRKLYLEKGCKYIQISDGYGLYHLDKDICGFNVPLFELEQQLRIRIKVHHTKTTKGFCSLSVTAACQPKNIKKLSKSSYSIDNINKLPINLVYNPD
jgi:hypothetical protein